MRTTIFRPTVWGLALGLLAVAGAAQAQGGNGDKDKEIKKKTRIVVINKDGEQQVIEGDGGNLPRVRRGYLGIGLTDLTPELRTHFGAPEKAGVMVSRVEAGSPAEKAGIRVGDILTTIEGDEIGSGWDVRSKVRDYEDGQQVPLEVWRGGRAQTLTVTMVQKERPEIDLSHLFTEEGGRRVLRLPAGELMDGMRLREPLVIPLDGNDTVTPGGVRIRRFHEREAELQKQLEEMEKRLNELERQLKKKD